MGARRFTLRIWLLAAAVLLVLLLIFFTFVYAQFMGWGGWQPDKSSVYAKRADLIDDQLTIGMSRDAVMAIFHKDAVAHKRDSWEKTSHAYWGNGVTGWADEADLYIFEPRPHFWNSFDTMWTVRAGFDSDGRLIHHTVHLGDCCGP
jgi:hypothetical protein